MKKVIFVWPLWRRAFVRTGAMGAVAPLDFEKDLQMASMDLGMYMGRGCVRTGSTGSCEPMDFPKLCW